MESKEHRAKRVRNTKYNDMENCKIRETRNKPYQLIMAERMRERKNEKQTTDGCEKGNQSGD